MSTSHRLKSKNRTQGFALLMAVLISSVVLAVGLSILNITLKQFIFSGIGRESEIAFYAADAGMECALYWDTSSQGGKFDIGNNTTAEREITCVGQTELPDLDPSNNLVIDSGDASRVEFEWGTAPAVCTKISVTKYFSASGPVAISPGVNCPQNATCTRVESRGYNRSCSAISAMTPGTADARVVERALRASY